MRNAAPGDVAPLVELMAEFYAEAGYELNRRHAAEAFAELLANEQFGRIWLMEEDSEPAGYLVLTLGYSMEYGGLSGWVEDLFVRAPFRNRGLAKAAMQAMREYCVARAVRVVSVEVGGSNDAAQQVYRRAGFLENDRQLLTLELATPAHVR